MPKWRIEISSGDSAPQTIDLEAEVIRIGKETDCEIRLIQPLVSRYHAELRWDGNVVCGRDLQSTHGVYCRGERVAHFTLVHPEENFNVVGFELRVIQIDDGNNPFIAAAGLKLLETWHTNLIAECDLVQLNEPAGARVVIENFVREHAAQLPLWCAPHSMQHRLLAEVIGFGPLRTAMDDPNVSEIMVNGEAKIFLIRRGRMEIFHERFISEMSLRHCIQRLLAPIGRTLDEANPMVDARIPGRGRLNAVIPPLSLSGTTLTIRKGSAHKIDMQTLLECGALTPSAAQLLKLAVEQHCNLIVAGGTDTGKTTMLNVLSDFIEPTARIITLEDTAELRLAQPHVITLEARPANLEGSGMVALRDLVRNALRMRPDRLIVGECRGGEALDMLQAMNTGHEGCMTTLHANSPRDALARIETLCLLSGIDLPLRSIREQIAAAIDLVIYLERSAEGIRRINCISEVGGLEEGTLTSHDLFTLQHHGKLQPTGIVPHFLQHQSQRDIAHDALALFTA